jgi:hypothetical protein
MKTMNRTFAIDLGFLSAFLFLGLISCSQKEKTLGTLPDGSVITALKNGTGTWGLAVACKGVSSFSSLSPVSLEIVDSASHIATYGFGYDKITREKNGFQAVANIEIDNRYQFTISDAWLLQDNCIKVNRELKVVKGEEGSGFFSAIIFSFDTPFPRDSVAIFVPGILYGGTKNIPYKGIGGEFVYKEGKGQAWIREDRMPAPLYGFYFKDGSSVSMLDEKPDGNTIRLDSAIHPVMDERIRFGSLGSEFNADGIVFGYLYPCSEGEISYGGDESHTWRKRYHPVNPELKQNYEVTLRLSGDRTFPLYYSGAWRWAWNKLNPDVNFQDIETARRSLVNMLGDNVEYKDGRYGITNFVSSVKGDPWVSDRKCVMGFTGKALETAEFLIYGSYDGTTAGDLLHYKLGNGIINTFLKLKMNPPVGEGFNLDNGKPALALPRDSVVYLRSFSDDMKALARNYLFELDKGIDHTDWKSWLTQFGGWLLETQYPSGGFPRAWEPATGKIAVGAPQSSYNPIPFLTLMSEITGDKSYLDAASRAGDFCWNNGQSEGIFVGGTIDNPNVIDKEAGTLSLEAYLALYDATGDKKWLDHAIMAANFAETWIYLWDIPMPEDIPDGDLSWKHGVPTTGVQLISTGHSGADCYMAFDTDEFAKLYTITADTHYYNVAKILLHNTKGMMALPGRLYDLRGPGWAQESWFLSVRRARGWHRGWLPWVSTSNLNGIYGLKHLDADLYNDLISRP